MSYLDYAKKTGGFGQAFFPSGDVRKDMDTIRAFYHGKQGKFPALFGHVRLREEREEGEEREEREENKGNHLEPDPPSRG
jgi:hypothetical protein